MKLFFLRNRLACSHHSTVYNNMKLSTTNRLQPVAHCSRPQRRRCPTLSYAVQLRLVLIGCGWPWDNSRHSRRVGCTVPEHAVRGHESPALHSMGERWCEHMVLCSSTWCALSIVFASRHFFITVPCRSRIKDARVK
jgi:hypothetical protein